MQTYRGANIESYEGNQVGYDLPNSIGTRAKVGISNSRKFKGYEITGLPGQVGSKLVDTLKQAKQYIDNYLGENDKSIKTKGYTRIKANVGDTVIWNSKTGPVEAEFRGQTMGMDGYEATIIVRPAKGESGSPFQITVNTDQIKIR